MEAVLSRLRGLSDDELREEFARAELKCGPITTTTRATFERKLARVLAEADKESSSTEPENCFSSGVSSSATSVTENAIPVSAPAPTFAAKSSNSAETDGEESDFGYDVGVNPPEEDEISVKTSSASSAEVSNFQHRPETPSKPAQLSPTFYYGVCPLWDDVLARTGKRGMSSLFGYFECCFKRN